MLGTPSSHQQLQQQQQEPQQSHQHQQSHRALNNSTSSSSSNHAHPTQHLVNHRSTREKQGADDDYQEDNGMRIGHNYQAEIPQFIAYAPAPAYYEDEKAIRVWSPHNKIPEHVLNEFVSKARDKFYYNTEQALGMLSWHKFDLNRAYADLPNFVPYPNEWSVEDKVLFEQAYQFHEKQFNKIKQMLPDKSMASLINYYYGWKKTRTRASLMERQTRRFAAKRSADSNGSSSDEGEECEDENGTSLGKADSGEKEPTQANQSNPENPSDLNYANDSGSINISCAECQVLLREDGKSLANVVDACDEDLCEDCYKLSKLAGKRINNSTQLGDCYYNPVLEQNKRQILFTYSDVISLVEGTPEQGDIMLKYLDTQIQDRKREIQTKKQTLSQINEKIQPIADQITDLNMNEFNDILPEYKPTKIWTQDEIQLLIQGLRRYGKDFSAISDIIRTKSPETIKIFFTSQKERMCLGRLVNEFEENTRSSALPAADLKSNSQAEDKTMTQKT